MARGRKKEPLTPEERLQAALVPKSEQPYKVPGNWCWVRLGKFSTSQYGYTAKAIKNDAYPKMLRITDIQEYGVNWGDVPNCEITQDNLEKYRLSDGDIVIARTGATTGKSFLLHDPCNSVFASYLIRLRVHQCAFPKYVFNFLQTDNYWKQISELSSGIAQPGVNATKLQSLCFPLPPLAEQMRIVDRIESLFARLDEAKQKAQDALDSFETRKAALLHKAFTGELTAQWRKEHGVGMESWGRLQWGSFIVSIEAGKNWSAEGRPPQADEFGVVKVSAVTWGEFNEVESKTCTVEEQWNENIQIHEGDFLFSRANTLQLVGNCVIVKSISRRLMLSDKILRFKFDKRVIPEYVLHFTRSNLYRNQIEQLASGNQDGMRNVSQKNMKLVEFPIPKLEEQKEIVRILGDLLAKEEQAKEAAEGVLEQIGLIKKAILARAFRGELGTNDPSEESSASLLC